MKRPPGLWCLLVVATFWLCVQDVDSLRATALILGKSPSAKTSTTEAPQEIDSEEGVTEASPAEETQNVTKPTLTGNPQIDYIWDPNLPRELNGYNLSEYPFYDRVPEDINFKCDGLHDGFYASVPHKCQVYHHCLFGVRYDFLCANYTAFDQKTFICHFVSEVDCLNSKKFWHRNDALYKAASTTTVKPVVVYTPPAAPATPVPIAPILNRRPGGVTGPGGGLRSRRPLRRRPQYDYYEDEYEDEEYEERRLRKRPRYRPRPVYEDDYEEYEEEAYVKRRPSRRRPYDRRGESRRTKEEKKRYEDDEYDDVDSERRSEKRGEEETRRRPSNRNRSRPNKRRPIDDEDYERRYERPKKRLRRPVDEDEYEDELPARRGNDRKKNKSRDSETDKDAEESPKKNKKNEERNTRIEGRNRNDDRNRNNDDKPKNKPEVTVKSDVNTEEPPLTKAPLSVYERKRPPKIRPPVPISEQSKYIPKTTTSHPLDDEEYYDDYEDEEPVKETKRTPERRPVKESPKRPYGTKQRTPEYEDEEPIRRTTKRPQSNSKDRRVGSGSRRRPVLEEYDDYEEKQSKSSSDETQTTTTKEPVKERHEPVVKVLKRPFLPSRGGNPYSARGLLPVGLKSVEETPIKDEQKVEIQKQQEIKINDEDQKQQPIEEVKTLKPALKSRNKYGEDDFKPVTNRPVSRINIVKITTTTTTTTTEKPLGKNPLDLDENEYDVTLNDALNPTIPNLPVRNFPTGFSSQNDYNYNTVQRSRYIADPTLNQASSDYVYRIEPLQSRYVPVYQPYRQTPRQHQAFYAGY